MAKKPLDILQWNCRGLRASLPDLQTLVQDQQPAVICLQETKITDPDYNILTQYHHTRKLATTTSTLPKGGVSIFVNKHLLSSAITLRTTLQAVAVRVTLHTPVSICSIYLPPNSKWTAQDLQDIIQQLPAPTILLGDFNAHHPLWGNSRTDQAGREVERLLTSSNLCLLNDKRATYCHPATATLTAIDLSITSPSILQDYQWNVEDNPHGSDHFPITLKSTHQPPPTTPSGWAFKRADWDRFSELCNFNIDSPSILTAPDPAAEFSKAIINIADQAIPKCKHKGIKPAKPWFNQECKDAIQTRHRAFHKVKTNPTMANIQEYSTRKAATRRTMRQSKRASWSEFVSKLNSRTPARKVWNIIRKISGKKTPTPRSHLCQGNTLLTRDKEVADTIAQTFAFNSSSAHYSPEFQAYKQAVEATAINFNSSNSEEYNTPFSTEELQRSLQLSHDTAAGPDDIHYQLLRHLPDKAQQCLLELFNHIWKTNYFPPSWQQATVLPIPKPGKPPTDPSSYRPIALTSCICKTMERMVNNRLIWYLEHNNIINNYQSGFRKGRSTFDHLVRLEAFIREAFVEKKHVLAICFDLEKAYDTTWRYGCLTDLQNAGLKGHLPNFIAGFLSNRHFRVRSNHTFSDNFLQEMGVPQGSILSVTLFCLRINDIIQNLCPGVDCGLYVDDFTIYIRATTVPEAERQAQQVINNLQQWCNHSGFKFSPSKTECILFRRSRAKPKNPTLLLNGTIIPVISQVKFLGIIFDNKLSFIPHIQYLKNRCLKTLNLIKVVAHYEWGGDQQTLLNLYRALIRSKLDYGCFIYGSARTSYLKMLNPVVNQALRLCLGAYRTSPEASLHVEAGELPILLRRTKLALQYTTKLASNRSHPAYDTIFHPPLTATFRTAPKSIPPLGIRLAPSLHRILPDPTNTMQAQPLPLPPWQLKPPLVIFDRELLTKKNTTAPEVYRSRFREISLQFTDHQAIFTDGSKDGVRTAAAAVILPHTLMQRLPDGSSIYSAELRAILLAITHIATCRHPDKYIIYSDSLSALQAIAGASTNNPLTAEILIQLHSLATLSSIIFCWVPSHVGIAGNEMADQAAKAALNLPISTLQIPATDLRPAIHSYVTEIWQGEWDANPQANLHQIQPKVLITTKQKHRSLRRREQTIISRLRIGHTRLTHEYLLEGTEPPVCTPCNAPLTVEHILINCIDFQPARDKHYSVHSLSELFSNCQPSAILKFLNEIQLHSKI